MFTEEEQQKINQDAQDYLKELEGKGAEEIFKAFLTWQVIHQSAMYEKIFEEQERICILLEEFLDIVDETDDIISPPTQKEDEYTSLSKEVDYISIANEDHHPLFQELFQ